MLIISGRLLIGILWRRSLRGSHNKLSVFAKMRRRFYKHSSRFRRSPGPEQTPRLEQCSYRRQLRGVSRGDRPALPQQTC